MIEIMGKATTRTEKDTTCRAEPVKLSLEELLQEIRRRRVILTPSPRGRIVPWSPNVRLARPIRSAIAQHNRELSRMIMLSDIEVCAAPGLHRQEWDYRRGRYSCTACERLWPEVS